MNRTLWLVAGLLLSAPALWSQSIPLAPNQRTEQGRRMGAWVILYDRYGGETTNPDSMVFYRQITFGANELVTGPVKDTYRSGKPRFEGQILTLTPYAFHHGWCVWYHPNGQKAKQGRFYYNIADSLYTEWDDAGRVIFDATYRRSPTGEQITAKVRVDEDARSFVAKLQTPMLPQQTYADYVARQITPVMANINDRTAVAGNMLGIIWRNEQLCWACVQRYSSKGGACSRSFKVLADSYAAFGYQQAADYYEKALELADFTFGPLEAGQAGAPPTYGGNEFRQLFIDYAIYAIRYGRFDKAVSLLDRYVARVRSASDQNKLSIYELRNCIELYMVAKRFDKAQQLIADQQKQRMTGGHRKDTDLLTYGTASDSEISSVFDELQRNRLSGEYVSNVASEMMLAIGDAYLRNGRLADAEKSYVKLYDQFLATQPRSSDMQQMGIAPWQDRNVGEKKRYLPLVLKRLIDVYERTGQSEKAEPLVLELRKVYPDHLTTIKTFYTVDLSPLVRSKSDDEITSRAIENEGPATFNFVLNHQAKYPVLTSYAFDNALMLKTLSYASVYELATQPLSETTLQGTRIRDVRRVLQPGEAVVEFVSFRQYTDHWTDTTLYAALVLRHGETHPRMARLCTGFDLKALAPNILLGKERGVNQLYKSRGVKVERSSADSLSGDRLYQLVWKPIEGWFSGIKTIHIAPSGELNKVAFAALPMNAQTVLADSFRIRQVISTSSIIKRPELYLAKTDSIAFFGAIRYDIDRLQLEKLPKSPARALPRLPIAAQGSLKPLDGTIDELNTIRTIFTKIYSYTGLNATEAQVRFVSPKILHFATHGFYSPELKPLIRDADPYQDTDRKALVKYGIIYGPLLRSGLLMAGANYVWQGNQPVRGIDDGILSAFEIANMTLPNTRLVVLSACETALGDVRGNETVVGFQRAFKMIGVQRIMASLWQVPDKETAEFMQNFYKKCVEGKQTVSMAFYQTQQLMRKKYAGEPYKWAAFTLIE